MRSPYASKASVGCAAGPGAGATTPGSAEGLTFSFCGVDEEACGVGAFLESSEPTWSFDLYFLRMLSLWYFQNCFEASLPPTRCKTATISACPPQRSEKLTLFSTWMLVLERGQVIHVLIDNDPQILGRVMRCNIAGREGFGHGERVEWSFGETRILCAVVQWKRDTLKM